MFNKLGLGNNWIISKETEDRIQALLDDIGFLLQQIQDPRLKYFSDENSDNKIQNNAENTSQQNDPTNNIASNDIPKIDIPKNRSIILSAHKLFDQVNEFIANIEKILFKNGQSSESEGEESTEGMIKKIDNLLDDIKKISNVLVAFVCDDSHDGVNFNNIKAKVSNGLDELNGLATKVSGLIEKINPLLDVVGGLKDKVINIVDNTDKLTQNIEKKSRDIALYIKLFAIGFGIIAVAILSILAILLYSFLSGKSNNGPENILQIESVSSNYYISMDDRYIKPLIVIGLIIAVCLIGILGVLCYNAFCHKNNKFIEISKADELQTNPCVSV